MLREALVSFVAIGFSSAGVVSNATALPVTTKPATLVMAPERGSNNWAGYVDVARPGAALTSITGTWKVPSITGAEQSAAAQWIGLGGVRANALLQMGTVEAIQNGQAVNTLFWEQLPQSANDWLSVPAGAVVNASIQPVSGQSSVFELKAIVQVGGQSNTYTKQVDVGANYAQLMEQSAEWISEDPSNQNLKLIPLASMGKIQYTNATTNHMPIIQSDARTQRMALLSNNNGPQILLQTSGLSAGNTAFTTQPGGTNSAGIGIDSGSGGSQGNGLTVLPFPNGSPATGPNSGFGRDGDGTWMPVPPQSQWQNWQQLQSQLIQQLQQQLQRAFGQGNTTVGEASLGGGNGFGTGSGTASGNTSGNGQWHVQIITPGSQSWGNFQQQLGQQLQQVQNVWQWLWSGIRSWGEQVLGIAPPVKSSVPSIQQTGFDPVHGRPVWFSNIIRRS